MELLPRLFSAPKGGSFLFGPRGTGKSSAAPMPPSPVPFIPSGNVHVSDTADCRQTSRREPLTRLPVTPRVVSFRRASFWPVSQALACPGTRGPVR